MLYMLGFRTHCITIPKQKCNDYAHEKVMPEDESNCDELPELENASNGDRVQYLVEGESHVAKLDLNEQVENIFLLNTTLTSKYDCR